MYRTSLAVGAAAGIGYGLYQLKTNEFVKDQLKPYKEVVKDLYKYPANYTKTDIYVFGKNEGRYTTDQKVSQLAISDTHGAFVNGKSELVSFKWPDIEATQKRQSLKGWFSTDVVKKLQIQDGILYALLKSGQLRQINLESNKTITMGKAQDFELADRVVVLKPGGVVYSGQQKLELPQVRQMSCGSKHCLFLTKDHQLYGIGSNDQGQLALPASTTLVDQPIEMKSFWSQLPPQLTKEPSLKCVDIKAVDDASFMELEVDGEVSVYSVGSGKLNGRADPAVFSWRAGQVSYLNGLTQFDDEGHQTPIKVKLQGCSTHMVAELESGNDNYGNDILCWGMNNFPTGKKMNKQPLQQEAFFDNGISRLQKFSQKSDKHKRVTQIAVASNLTAFVVE